MLGVALLVAAVVVYLTPSRAAYATPRWLQRLQRVSPWTAAVAGAALTVVNLKIVIACAAAGYAIGVADLNAAGIVITVAFFTLAGGSTAALAILAYAVWSHRVDPNLERFRLWLQRRQHMLTVGTTALIGAALVVSGVGLIA
ncbi:GAP family protein [Mycolicibacterium sp. S2-37]|nr:GAP family protein [Mycolicibacterium sp. S2-37]